jgi:hypothetical protein
MPAQFAQGLFKRTSLETTHNKEISGLDEIVPCLVRSPSLRSNVQRRAVSNVPAVFFLHGSEKLKGGLDYSLHKIRVGEGICTRRNCNQYYSALSTGLDARETPAFAGFLGISHGFVAM